MLARASEAEMENSKPVDQPSRETVKVRQGTGPREMVSVLVVSLLGAIAVGALLLVFFYFGNAPPR
jgi:hypothetical protein